MELNNLRVESHVAQKNRRRKLRFQQNSGDMNTNTQHSNFEPKDNTQRPFSYNTNVFPSEMFNSVARNPHLLLPSSSTNSTNSTHGFVSHDHQDLVNPQNFVSTQQVGNIDHWNVVSIDQRSLNPYGYQQGHVDNHNNNNNNNNIQVFGSSPFYQNALPQDHQVTLAQLPQMNQSQAIIPCWMSNSDHDQHREVQARNHEGNCNMTQALSLSLSSVPQLKDSEPTLHSGQKHIKSDLLPVSDLKSFMGGHRNSGPLGPFTGYATVLKNSKYLKPAQELLNGNCDVGGQELVQACHDVYSQKILEEEINRAFSASSDNEHVSSRSNSGPDSFRPEFHRKKARLLYMQEEVCRRYKQYLQQMQMVISAFETVAGLSTSTPYVCLALKAVSRHFNCVKNVISDQLSQMRKIVGDGLCSSSSMGGKGCDTNVTSSSRLKSIEHRLEKSGGGSAGFFASQQPVWRPQRGLPERAISVLKTWLFDHFLHPYPSDADKHMLATQTGLTRNQVSNWFINARVRIWKPMVEEIHTLETKGLADQSNSTNPQPDVQESNQIDMGSLSTAQPEFSRNNGILTVTDQPNDQLQDHEKQQARPEYQMPLTNMDRLMSIMPYPRATFDASGLGPVSLTLGLRQNAEHVQQLQQHFGGQLIHDFVG